MSVWKVEIHHTTHPFMNTLRRLWIPSLLILLPVWSAGLDPTTSALMRTKLAVSRRLLGGIALADFGLIQTNAATLVTLSGQRGWTAWQSPEYELFTTQFRISAQATHDAAKNKDLDAVARAYHDLTLSCISCHKYLRDEHPKPTAGKP